MSSALAGCLGAEAAGISRRVLPPLLRLPRLERLAGDSQLRACTSADRGAALAETLPICDEIERSQLQILINMHSKQVYKQ